MVYFMYVSTKKLFYKIFDVSITSLLTCMLLISRAEWGLNTTRREWEGMGTKSQRKR